MSALFDVLRGVSSIQAAMCLGIDVKFRGRVAWALCPLHGEKGHASMWLSDERGWYCYGCHKGGDAVRLYEEYLGVEPIEAARQLARDMGIEVPEDDGNTLYVNVRHLRDALTAKRKELIRETSEKYLEVDDALELLVHNVGQEAAFDDPRFARLLEERTKLEIKLEVLQDASDSEILQIVKEEQNAQQGQLSDHTGTETGKQNDDNRPALSV